MSVSLEGSVSNRLRDAVAYMHRQRRRVVAIRGRIVRREEGQIRLRYRNAEQHEPSPEELDVLLDVVVGGDPKFRAAVANEQWGYRLTSAYALLRAAEQNDEIIRLLTSVDARLARLELADVPEVSRPPG